ncbi:MAG: hypothetical protein DWQ06_09010 [Calditrichaeota bacterium]|nr:MAG: hypothetical protein DWQ06_09010 [Calditrichota bacterium]
MKNSLKTLGLLTIATFVLGSCSQLKQVKNMAKTKKPTASITNVQFKNASFTGIDLAFDVKLENPNPIAVSLSSFDFDFKVNGNSFVKGLQDKKMTLAKNGSSTIEIPVSLNFNELYNTVKSVKNSDESTFDMACGFAFDVPILGETRVPVSKSGVLPTIKLPSVSVKGLKLDKMGFTGAEMELQLEFENPNSFDINLNKFDYDFEVSGKSWAKGALTSMSKATSKGKSEITIPVKLDFSQVGMTVYGMLTGNDKIDYNFKSDFDLGTSLPYLKSVDFPFDSKGLLDVLK